MGGGRHSGVDPAPGGPGGPTGSGGGRATTGDPDATAVLPRLATEPAGEPGGAEPTNVAGNSAILAIASLVSRFTGFLRAAALTAALGGGVVGDAYGTAQFFPGMIYELLLGGILGSVVVPVLVRARKIDADRGEAYAQRLLTLAVLALGAATLLSVVGAPVLTAILAGGGKPAFQSLVTALSYLILPTIFFYGLAALLGAVLNTRGHFAAPAWAPMLNNVVVIGTAGLYYALFHGKPLDPAQMGAGQIALLGGGTLLGIVAQSAGLVPALRRVGFRWRWRFDFRTLGLRELGRLGGWMFCYVAVSQIGVLVLLNLLSRANRDGNTVGVAIYNNVYLLLMMAHGIVAVSLITVLMPRMSAAASDRRHADLTADLARGIRSSMAVLAPIAVVYAVLAQPVMVTLFRWGRFTPENARDGAFVLLVAAVALIPFSISQLLTFAFYALPDTRTPALLNVPVVVVRVVVQIALFAWFARSFTASGLMVGNAVSYLLAAWLSAWLLRGRIGRIGLRDIMITGGKVLAAAAGSALVGLAVLRLLPGGQPPSRPEAMIQLALGGTAIGVAYVGLAALLRIREIEEVLALVRRKLGR